VPEFREHHSTTPGFASCIGLTIRVVPAIVMPSPMTSSTSEREWRSTLAPIQAS